jgi:photosystem II stability/assembly factor-like uncharacterized protein
LVVGSAHASVASLRIDPSNADPLPMRRPLRFTRARAPRARTRLLATIACVAAVLASWAAATGSAATAPTVVAAYVTSATTLDTTGCPALDPARTSFGSVLPGTPAVTTADCDVLFGSSNDTATLRTYRPSIRPTAMSTAPTTQTETLSQGRVLDMDMVDASVGWSVGDQTVANRVRKTTDGGLTWNTVATPIGGSGRAVSAPNLNDVWIARYSSNVVIRSGNGGSTWSTVSLGDINGRGNAIFASDASNAWIAGSSSGAPRIWRTVDGGTNWTTVCSGCTASTFTDIAFVPGTTTGWATTQNGDIYATTDGNAWSLQTSTGNALESIDVVDANRVMIVGSVGQIYVTLNGGTNWINRSPANDRYYFRDVSYRASGVAWVTSSRGAILRSTDHGVTWTAMSSRLEPTIIENAEATADTTLVIATTGEVFGTTTDTGATWQAATSPSPGSNWGDLAAADGARMWRVGTAGHVEATTDGTTWSSQASGTTEALYGIDNVDRLRVVAVGSNGTIRRTTNGGATWSAVASGTTATLRAVVATGDGRVWAVGDGGTVLRSSDDGATFTAVNAGTTATVTAVGAWNGTDVVIGTAGGVLRRSSDGGASWSTLVAAPSNNAVSALRPVPGTGTVWMTWGQSWARSTDYGATWTSGLLASGVEMLDADMVDGSTAWLTGKFGRIYRTTNGGGTWTNIGGNSGTRTYTAIAALGPDAALALGEANAIATTDATANVPDYDGAAASWAGGGFFGICLRAAPATGSTWPTTGSCPASDGTNWRAVPLHGGQAAASTASTLAPGTTTASFRFGLKAPGTTAPGTYRAPITFEVTAPSG